jgi:hypothetical protein
MAYEVVPDAAALGAWCDFLRKFDPDQLEGIPQEFQQAEMFKFFGDYTRKAEIDIREFAATLMLLPPEERQPWLASGVKKHGFEERCSATN